MNNRTVIAPLTPDQKSWFIHIKGFSIISHATFDQIWNQHPSTFAEITVYGRKCKVPRWVALYGDKRYYYKEEQAELRPSSSLPVINNLLGMIDQYQKSIGHMYEGYGTVLANWYDGSKGHYISHHSDDEDGLVPYGNIWTISYGDTRCFEFKSKITGDKVRVMVEHGDALIMGGTTQSTHTHSIIKPRVFEKVGRRISLTFRAFKTDVSENSTLIAYTDGSCDCSSGRGGWGVYIVDGDKVSMYKGGVDSTTSNRMELNAAYVALSRAKELNKPIIVNVDSTYVKTGITKWVHKWKRNGWKKSNGKDVKNRDIWVMFDKIANEVDADWKWVPGHSDNEGNDHAHRLATEGRLSE